jgi:hypothetical protein
MFAAEGLQEYHFAQQLERQQSTVASQSQADESDVDSTLVPVLKDALGIMKEFLAKMDDSDRNGGEGYLPSKYPGVRTAGCY